MYCIYNAHLHRARRYRVKEKTKQRALSFLEATALLLFAYPAGLLVGAWFLMGQLLGRLKILHEERMPGFGMFEKTIIVSNHPAVIDPFLIAFLLFRYYALSPLRHAPLIVADRLNFYDKWWFWPLKSVMVPVDRDDRRKQAMALLKIKKALDCGRLVIIFPEGGRTFKGNDGEFLYSQKGSKIRFLKAGLAFLVAKTGATILPVGIKGSDKVVPNSKRQLWTRFVYWEKIIMNVGDPMNIPPDTSREQITQQVAAKLLELIDEAS